MNKIYLNANENPYITFEKKELENLFYNYNYNRYPNSSYKNLRNAIAQKNHINSENIITTNGSDELIQLIIIAFSKENDSILSCEPTFSQYCKISSNLGRNYIGISPKGNLELDIRKAIKTIKEVQPKIIFLCYPNNPTGELIDEKLIHEIIKTSNGIVVIDEAYIEFTDFTNLKLIDKYDNLIIMRTLSKAYGLASLRIGYGVSINKHIQKLDSMRMPFNISGISEYIASNILEKIDFKKYNTYIINEKKRILKILDELNMNYFKSDSNFILLDSPYNKEIFDYCKRENIYIRDFDTKYLINFIRFSIGTAEENSKFIKILRDVVENE